MSSPPRLGPQVTSGVLVLWEVFLGSMGWWKLALRDLPTAGCSVIDPIASSVHGLTLRPIPGKIMAAVELSMAKGEVLWVQCHCNPLLLVFLLARGRRSE